MNGVQLGTILDKVEGSELEFLNLEDVLKFFNVTDQSVGN